MGKFKTTTKRRPINRRSKMPAVLRQNDILLHHGGCANAIPWWKRMPFWRNTAGILLLLLIGLLFVLIGKTATELTEIVAEKMDRIYVKLEQQQAMAKLANAKEIQSLLSATIDEKMAKHESLLIATDQRIVHFLLLPFLLIAAVCLTLLLIKAIVDQFLKQKFGQNNNTEEKKEENGKGGEKGRRGEESTLGENDWEEEEEEEKEGNDREEFVGEENEDEEKKQNGKGREGGEKGGRKEEQILEENDGEEEEEEEKEGNDREEFVREENEENEKEEDGTEALLEEFAHLQL